jgi:hypothetical protein
MRVFLACAMVVLGGGLVAAQQTSAGIPAAFMSPVLKEGWQLQPIYPTGEQSFEMALAWADAPNGRFIRYSMSGALSSLAEQFQVTNPPAAARPDRSTVGQGVQ